MNVYAEVKTIDCSVNTMVEFGISGAYIKHIKQEQGMQGFSYKQICIILMICLYFPVSFYYSGFFTLPSRFI